LLPIANDQYCFSWQNRLLLAASQGVVDEIGVTAKGYYEGNLAISSRLLFVY
jgi:hypothetical protein